MPTPAPKIISYQVFLASAKPNDIRALALLADNETIATADVTEAEGYQALGVRLFNAGLVTRFRRSLEIVNGEVWHVFDGRVTRPARIYLADACQAYLTTLQANPV